MAKRLDRADRLPVRGQRGLHRGALRPLSRRSQRGRPELARVFAISTTTARSPARPAAPVASAAGAPLHAASAATARGPRLLAAARWRRDADLGSERSRRLIDRLICALVMLIRAYRVRGHLMADLDPLGLAGDKHHPELDPKATASPRPTSTASSSSTTCSASRRRPCGRIVEILRQTYCGRIGVEFMHIQYPEQKAWIQARMEGSHNLLRLERRGEAGDPGAAGRSPRASSSSSRQVPRHQAVRPGRRRERDPGAGGDHPALRPARRRGDRARHAPSRPAQRARQHDGQALRRDLLRVPGRRPRPTTSRARATSSTTSAPRPTASCRRPERPSR